MELLVKKGVFNKDYSRPGLPLRNLLRQSWMLKINFIYLSIVKLCGTK
jgi:hypothetical protein